MKLSEWKKIRWVFKICMFGSTSYIVTFLVAGFSSGNEYFKNVENVKKR